MAQLLDAEDVRIRVAVYGRRPRELKLDWGQTIINQDEFWSGLEGSRTLRPNHVIFRVDVDAEECLFYSEAKMSEVECHAVTAWLVRYEDATLEVFARTLRKDIEEKEAEFARNLLSAEGSLDGDNDDELNLVLTALEQRLEVVEGAQERVRRESQTGGKGFESDEYGEDDEDGDDVDDDHERPYSRLLDGYLKDVIAEVQVESNRVESSLSSFFRGLFSRRGNETRTDRHDVQGDDHIQTTSEPADHLPSATNKGTTASGTTTMLGHWPEMRGDECTDETPIVASPKSGLSKNKRSELTVTGVHNEFFV